MISMETIIHTYDTRPRKVKAALKLAQDEALLFYRRQYLPLHFKATHSRLRYGDAYAKRGKASRGLTRRTDKRRKPNAGRATRDRGNKIPLFMTGLLKEKVLHGGVKHSGRYDRRKIKYSPPYYLFISAPGQINKLNAISARTKTEDAKVTEFAGKKFVKEIKSNQITLRSK